MTAHKIPTIPKSPKTWRQVNTVKSEAMSIGVIAAPHLALAALTPSAALRSSGVSQVRKTRASAGKQPDSPSPKSRRVTNNDEKFQTQPVAAVNRDHRM